MSTKYPQGIITPTPPYKSTTAKSFSGVWTLEQLANNFYYYRQAVQKSLRFRSSANAYLTRTPASAGNRRTWTWSGWLKRGALGTAQYFFGVRNGISDTDAFYLAFFSDNTFVVSSNSTPIPYLVTSQLFRDPSAWYHIVVAVDTTQVTSTNRIKVYVNGAQITSFSTATYPSQNANLGINQAYQHVIGAWYDGSSYIAPFDGYLAEINFIDGQALDPSYFGQISPITGVWSPAPYVGSYGTNGFYLKFTDTTSTTTLCYDYSGNSNNWTPNNISLTAGSTYDSMLDSPTNYDNGGTGVGNYAVLNPLSNLYGSTLSNANLTAYCSTIQSGASGTVRLNSGSWYFEETIQATGSPGRNWVGFMDDSYVADNNGFSYTSKTLLYASDGSGGITGGAYGASYTTGDVIGVAFNIDTGTIAFYKNGVSQGNLTTGASGVNWRPFVSFGATGWQGAMNFGQRPFAYTPPTGYKALNTQNLPAPSIQNGSNFMAATLYTGNGATQSIVNAVNGVSFKPDLVWIKSRSATNSHNLADSVRGPTAGLASNSTTAEYTQNGFSSFNASGFTLAADTSQQVNNNGSTYIGWQWKAGGTAVTNTAGSITSSVSANTTSGFAVVTYTGTGSNATVGHGLGVAPSMIINKSRNAAQNWTVFHAGLANMTTAYVRLNTTDAAGTLGNAVATPTSTTFGISASTADTSTYVAYCFAAIPGYSAFGRYTGNGSSDGPFVFTGMRPRYVMIKRTDSANDWVILDTARDTYNYAQNILWADLATAETAGGTTTDLDFLSNGFKLRGLGGSINASGGTYIYAAFAENPFNYSLAR